jgi:lysozyme
MVGSRSKTNRTLGYLLLIPAIAGVAIFAWRYFATTKTFSDEDTTFVRYPAFGIMMPTEYTIHGIDVSHHNKNVNWKLVKQMRVEKIRLGFSFIKATEGLTFIDDQFARNWKKSKQAGIIRGAYHYLIPYKSGEAQAQNFINTVDLKPGDLPPVLDVETIGGSNVSELRKNAMQWLETVENYYGVSPIIYTGTDFYSRYLGSDFDDYPLWNLWQHSMAGHVNGIQSFVDFNAFNGDSAAFKKLLIKD